MTLSHIVGFLMSCIILVLTLCILMDDPIHIDTISMAMSIMYFKGSQVEFSKL